MTSERQARNINFMNNEAEKMQMHSKKMPEHVEGGSQTAMTCRSEGAVLRSHTIAAWV